MSKLFRFNDFIIDVKEERIHRVDGSGSTTFSFEEMWCYVASRTSQMKPVRYCEKNKQIMYWQNGKWNSWSSDMQEAINILFNACIDNHLLED